MKDFLIIPTMNYMKQEEEKKHKAFYDVLGLIIVAAVILFVVCAVVIPIGCCFASLAVHAYRTGNICLGIATLFLALLILDIIISGVKSL